MLSLVRELLYPDCTDQHIPTLYSPHCTLDPSHRRSVSPECNLKSLFSQPSVQFIFDICSFVVDHCIFHPIAATAAKLIQDVIAKAGVLGEKLLGLQDLKKFGSLTCALFGSFSHLC